MTKPAFRRTGTALSRCGLIAGAAVFVVSLAVGCSAVKPAGGGAAGAGGGANGTALGDSFGTPATPDQVKQGARW